MKHAIRPTLAALGALVVVAVALAATIGGTAHAGGQALAADQTVKITQIRSSNGIEFALSVYTDLTGKLIVSAKIRNDKPSITVQRWIKHDKGNGYATYENVGYPGKCMQALTKTDGEVLTLGTCQNGDSRQMWTQGFDTGTYRKLENFNSHYVVTHDTNGSAFVKQRFDQNLETQNWAIVGV